MRPLRVTINTPEKTSAYVVARVRGGAIDADFTAHGARERLELLTGCEQLELEIAGAVDDDVDAFGEDVATQALDELAVSAVERHGEAENAGEHFDEALLLVIEAREAFVAFLGAFTAMIKDE